MWYQILKFELLYRSKRPETYIYFAVVFLFSIVSFNFIFESVDLGMVKENAPFLIAKTMAIVSGFFMIIISMIMGVPILRDYEHKIESLMFTNPISKADYFIGRFLGSFVILMMIMSGQLWGMFIGEMMPWRETVDLLPIDFWSYLQPFLTFVIPNSFLAACLFFVSGTLSRKMLVVYTQGLVFFLVFMVSRVIDNTFISALLDPFGFTAIDSVIEYWNLDEQHSKLLPLSGILLYNRTFWLVIAIAVFIKGYLTFNFQVLKEKRIPRNQRLRNTDLKQHSAIISIPKVIVLDDWKAGLYKLLSSTKFYFHSLLKEGSFWAIVIVGVVTILINSINLGSKFGVSSLPTSYLIVAELKEMSIYFFLIILIFFTGELIWKEHTVRVNLISDALPIPDAILLSAKFIGILLTYILLLLILVMSGLLFQTFNGYFHFDFIVYFTALFLEILPFLIMFTSITFFFQVISSSKFIGYVFVILFFLIIMAMGIFGFSHGLYQFGGNGLGRYSEMNGYGHFMKPFLLFKVYWLAFCMFVFVITILLNFRGTENSLRNRFLQIRNRITRPLSLVATFSLLTFFVCGSFIFYNTNIINTYYTSTQQNEYRAAYEKNLKKYEYILQPKIIDINLHLDLFPGKRGYELSGKYILENQSDQAIKEIHIQKIINESVTVRELGFDLPTTLNDTHSEFGYLIYVLEKEMKPGERILMNFEQVDVKVGFSESNDDTKIVYNGTFINNDQFPTLGYSKKYELEEERADFGLEEGYKKAGRDNKFELQNARTGDDGSKIKFEIVIGTSSNQIAIAPGSLINQRTENDRNYFHYKMSESMINFYAIVSAKYETMKDEWVSSLDIVDLEIYHHPRHVENLNRMMNSMKASLSYYSENFSAFPYHEMRIMEYPRYQEFAQSYPGTVPYSEAIGFIMDIDDNKDLDIPFFITAHEVAHQWWGLNVLAANVKGKHLILETLAQYSALMVMKNNYGEESAQRVLDFELGRYKEGSGQDANSEVPLALVEDQDYIYYSKGAINMYALQNYISEDSVNIALQRFIKDWNFIDGALGGDRYATSGDLMDYFKEVTPDSLDYILSEMFDKVVTYDMNLGDATQLSNDEGASQISLTIEGHKQQVNDNGMAENMTLDEWVDIGIYSFVDGADELIKLDQFRIQDSINLIRLDVDQNAYKVVLDPMMKLLDFNREDNEILIQQ